MSQQTARLAARAMQQVVLGGTGHRARIPGREVAGKTGTANDYHDAWFVGFTPQLSTAVWMGSWIGEIPMRGVGGINVFGGTYPARIWQAYMSLALQDLPAVPFPEPESTRPGVFLHLPDEPDEPTSTTDEDSPISAPPGNHPPTTKRPSPN
jgi:penicillin-binding protein 1A